MAKVKHSMTTMVGVPRSILSCSLLCQVSKTSICALCCPVTPTNSLYIVGSDSYYTKEVLGVLTTVSYKTLLKGKATQLVFIKC